MPPGRECQVEYNQLTICHCNVQGFINNRNSIEIFSNFYNASILCITEHWIPQETILNTDFYFNDYTIGSYFAREIHSRGGSLIFVKNIKTYKEINSIKQLSQEGDIEMCALYCKVGEVSFNIINVYRPPGGNIITFFEKLYEALEIASKRCKWVVLCGDFNIDHHKKNCPNVKKLTGLFEAYNLSNNRLFESTRIFTDKTGHTSSTCIDYMMTNFIPSSFSCDLIVPNVADHLSHLLRLPLMSIEKPKPVEIIKRLLYPENIQEYRNRLSLTNWEELFYLDVNKAFSFFMETLTWCFEVSCPKKRCLIKRNSKCWVSDRIRKQSREIKELYKLQLSENSSIEMKQDYKEKLKQHKKDIQHTKRQFNKKRIEEAENKSKETWKIVNEQLGRQKKNDITTFIVEDNEIGGDCDVAKLFAQFFSGAASHALYNHFGCNLSLPCTVSQNLIIKHQFQSLPITEANVMHAISSMKNKNTMGVDELSLKTISQVLDLIIRPFTFLANQSLSQGIFPSLFKTALVIPIHKKGPKTSIENYRQISLLSSLSKVMEKIVSSNILSYLEMNNLLCDNQHGFRPGRSVETATCQLLDFVQKNIDKNKYVVSLMFDLSKAFDTICPENLILKLKALGFPSHMIDWLTSYVTGRRMVVKYNTSVSNTHDVDLGVPQGSVLGPLLFAIYVNDLPQFLQGAHVTMYADDTTITICGADKDQLICKMRDTICQFNIWCQRNKLILNVEKTMTINFHLRKSLFENDLSNQEFSFQNEVSFLGSRIDSTLTWGSHIDIVCSKLNKAFFCISQLKGSLDRNGLLNVYYAMAYSNLSFNILCWGRSRDVSKVFVCQKRIIRLIFGMEHLDSCKPIFIGHSILTVFSIYILKSLLFAKNNLADFGTLSETHNYNTRHGSVLKIPPHRTSSYKRSPEYNAITLFNKLPQHIKNISNILIYKKAIKNLLLKNCYYSIEEYLDTVV